MRAVYRAILGLAGLCTLLAVSGCGTAGYFADRGRDAADIVTLSVGKGDGVQLRGGPLQLGWMYTADHSGLRGGTLMSEDDPEQFPPDVGGLITPLFSTDAFEPRTSGTLVRERSKTYRASGTVILTHLDKVGKWPYYTQLEGAIGIVGHLRFGLNIGELADFLLGWTTLDLADDDVGTAGR